MSDSEVMPEPTESIGEPEPTVKDQTAGFDETVFRVMDVGSVRFDLAKASPQVHLTEAESPYRHLSITIALPEAQAMHNALEGVPGLRPTTHELMSAVIASLQADIIAVRILRHENGIFFSELDLMTVRGREKFDCRTSDGIILALRQAVRAPILCAEDVIKSFYL